ncbi:MAG: DUF5106 domain-containing protein [Bacteroidales bacterium]|jgi:thiol-disulfide isomerase/thioredoxin|nr:DUF5106 domain-containing protein [Bacteroidales bacterium]MDD2204210.1 DUF5106 domain-containing protein [Bacteroidales bacterium]MDD3152857.1 DUF5106 domain-containing protein [Bacteroidales bacterium]MDD3913617.1 DUF5106 domain-containing protein [Bacteroidales bacterium]MDD4633615.1 DUF5106 domain-containing protein [Bacteroidales bacterium]
MNKKIIITVFMAFYSLLSYPKTENYNITVELENYNDSIIYLCNYYGNNIYIIDSATIYKSSFVFSGDSLLPSGVYLIVNKQKSMICDFMIDVNSQNFKLSTNYNNVINKMEVKNSDINKDFFSYMKFLNFKRAEILPYNNKISELNCDSLQKIELKSEIDKIDKDVNDFTTNIINKNANNILGLFLKSNLPVLPPILPDSVNTPKNRYNAYIRNFWDNFTIEDERMLRTPNYDKKLTNFFDKIIIQQNDSICITIDRLMKRVENTDAVKKYLLWYFTNKYEHAGIMGQDAVFVYIIDKYYAGGYDNWSNRTMVQALIDRANEIRPTLIGSKAANLRLVDTAMKPNNLYDINSKYLIIYFWDDDCSHCKAETPKLVKLYNERHELYNFDVYGVYTGASVENMKQYIIDNNIKWTNAIGNISPTGDNYEKLYDVSSTPGIFLLDKDRLIIAKKILIDELGKYLEWIVSKDSNE